MSKLDYFRPKARHIFTIGRDLIKDDFSALIELVKNSYDADASVVKIYLENIEKGGVKISVKDDGHGMTEDVIREKWLVPSTDHKKNIPVSPNGRILQGKKGIGRYATAVLGENLLLTTVTKNGEKSIVNIDWRNFEQDVYLDEIHLDIDVVKTSESKGTNIEIIGDEKEEDCWMKDSTKRKLKLELERLKPPYSSKKEDNFDIELYYFGEKIKLEYNSFHELYDYKISGEIDSEGNMKLTYKNADTKKEIEINKALNLDPKKSQGGYKLPGKIKLHLFVLDRDPAIKRDPISKSFGRIFDRSIARSYYDKFSGVSIYRGDFRIRPYGEEDFDWLNLNLRRVNNPSLNISTNQIIGYITIENEEKSGLEEASSREGLKENEFYIGLIMEIRFVLSELEELRWNYRGSVGLREKSIKEVDIEGEVKKLEEVVASISDDNSKETAVKEIQKFGEKVTKEKERLENIITQYEGQVTLGKLLGITFHEVSKPTKYMRENLKYLDELLDYAEKNLIGGLGEAGEKIHRIITGYSRNASIVSDFMYKKLQPLVRGKGKPVFFNFYEVIENSFETFESEITKSKINIEINIDKNIEIYGYRKDFVIALTNFIDNSIYWINEKADDVRNIVIDQNEKEDILEIYFKDDGFGIDNIEDYDDIIEPGFSRKTDEYGNKGSGLGLSIAGEVLQENNIQMKILGKDELYSFIIKLTIEKWKK